MLQKLPREVISRLCGLCSMLCSRPAFTPETLPESHVKGLSGRGWCWFKGVRIGEARKPGPGSALDDPQADLWEEESQLDDASLWPAEPVEPESEVCGLSASDAEAAVEAEALGPKLCPVWNGDLAFTEEQLLAWREAEDAAGLSRRCSAASSRKASARPPRSAPAAESAVDGFIKSSTTLYLACSGALAWALSAPPGGCSLL